MSESGPLIDVCDVTVRYGTQVAVDGVSFAVGQGEVAALVGPNGAGKTTTLRVITGFFEAEKGTVLVAGHDVVTHRRAALSALGYLPESVPLYGDMTVFDYLRFRARLKGVHRTVWKDRIAEAMAATAVAPRARQRIATLSRGFRQRVALSDALLTEPSALVLDEPTTGLDPLQVREFRALITKLAVDRAVLLSSHALADLESIVTRYVVMVGGKIMADCGGDGLRVAAGVDCAAPLEDAYAAVVSRELSKEQPA